MGRWEPNAQSRLRQAAMDLYASRGFERTTVAEIAEKAGLTERTFFRHFADKREVFFAGSERLRELLVATVTDAPVEAGPAQAVAAAFESVAADYFPPVAFSRQRQSVIDANISLQERELVKLHAVAAELAAALQRRGVSELRAAIAAESGVAAFKVAFSRWINDPDDRELSTHMREALAELRRAA
ncbi:TetR/AcrR family transcriptional regulator [Actinoplanes bogorensis]|uniref:TetR/AcrR family transcriptional regulator n=1 Tax=Paractinoplanes bogorensis TaxID=1610840 RepID=A0ABS5Z145_9ACTN|nr:TetR family transcriptional regulator [Actinoplanes bogorensis]MBU2669383.1 TetR/AcrR family transcriptional regulator [Actinoplanes bogorensis]